MIIYYRRKRKYFNKNANFRNNHYKGNAENRHKYVNKS